MPLYEFRCDPCGEFDAWRKMAEASLPMPCPTCSAIATRLFSAPSISLNQGSLAIGGSSSEPQLVKRPEREPTKPRYQNPQGRPWMIGHATERL